MIEFLILKGMQMADAAKLAQIIDKYRSVCDFYVKLDFAGVGVLATIATITRPGLRDVAFFAPEIGAWISICAVAAAAGLTFDRIMLRHWHEAILGECNEKIARTFAWLITLQVAVHAFLLALIAGFSVGFIQSIYEHSANH
jgi:hypothetical protein